MCSEHRVTTIADPRSASGLGIGGLDHLGKVRAAVGIAGLNDQSVTRAAHAGVAGYLSSKVRQRLPRMLTPRGDTQRSGLGDRAAEIAYAHGVYFVDFSYLACTTGTGNGTEPHLRWRSGRAEVFGPGRRVMPLYLDAGAYRLYTGHAPRWVSRETYLAAIDLLGPEGFAAFDVIGDQAVTQTNFDWMCAAGYGPERGCFPVWQVRESYDHHATMAGVNWRAVPDEARCAVANARLAARDPVLRYYAARSSLIGLGGMVRGPIPRDVRHWYIAELARLFPDHHFWALGQANYKVVNGLGSLGLLDRISLDGTWWLLDAACDRFGVVKDGQIVMLSLEGWAQSLFTIEELMAANLRCILGAYAGLWQFPPMPLLPNLRDPEAVQELQQHLQTTQLELFGPAHPRPASAAGQVTAALLAVQEDTCYPEEQP